MKNQINSSKIKTFYVFKCLVTKSNPYHPITATDIIDYLKDFNIPAQRRAIYRDIEILRSLGIQILKNGYRYYYKSADGDFIQDIIQMYSDKNSLVHQLP